MTAQGSPISVLRRALRAGSLGAVDMALFEVEHLDMQDALEVVLLMARADDPRFDRWAQRWAERSAAAERERVTALFARLPDEEAIGALRAHAERLRTSQPIGRVPLRPSAPESAPADGRS